MDTGVELPGPVEGSAAVLDAATNAARRIRAHIESFVKGKPEVVELAMICLVAEGHLLLEDVPGVGKTSLARAMAQSAGVTWARIQFTPDLLPSEVTGVSVFHQERQAFEFQPGPIFASIVVADEINRATPRTQAALLEAMEEGSVSVDGVTRPLPSPFLVIATQNPIDMAGTYALPEAQLDRFMMKTAMGYPDRRSESEIVTDHHRGASIASLTSVATPADIGELIALAGKVNLPPAVIDYIVDVVSWTRSAPGVDLGASPRASVALMRAIRARALLLGRDIATPADVQALAEPVLAHRILLSIEGEAQGLTRESVVAEAVATVPAPQPG